MILAENVVLYCCKTLQEIRFRHAEAPALPSNQFRKTVECPGCSSIVIITMTKTESGAVIEQEVI